MIRIYVNKYEEARNLISIKVPDELKEKMKKYPHINWSEIARSAISRRIELEERLSSTEIDQDLLNEAIKIQDRVRNKTSITEDWSSTEEIRKWREQRK